MQRVQVRCGRLRTGAVRVSLKSVWADKRGNHIRNFCRGAYDLLAVFCEETNEIYFIDAKDIKNKGITYLTPRTERKVESNEI
jgi:hypothetical protein